MTDPTPQANPPKPDYSYKAMLANTKNIPPEEPVFLLRAQDITAAATVLIWAAHLHTLGSSGDKVKSALLHASAMAMWPHKKIPD